MNIRESMRAAIASNSPTFVTNMYEELPVSSDQVTSFVNGQSTLTLRQMELVLTYLDLKLVMRKGA